MKKHILSLAAALLFTFFAGCAGNGDAGTAPENGGSFETNMPQSVRIGAMNGPTALGLLRLMDLSEADRAAQNYEFTIGVIDEMVALISRGDVDMAAIPANLASVLYNSTNGEILVLAINTLGVLYIVETGDSINSVSDLAGKTVYATGHGAVPELILNYILLQNGLNPDTDLNIEFRSEPVEILPLLQRGGDMIAMLPQPFVASAQQHVDGLRIALDLTEEWDIASDGESQLITGVMVVRRDFAEKYPEAVALFLDEYAASVAFVTGNIEEAAQLAENFGIINREIALRALPYCNITFIAGLAMKDALSGYLQVLHDQNPRSVGGAMPDEDFYFISEIS